MRKTIIFTLVMSFVLLLASTCFASEKPLGDITSDKELTDKLFTGRTLDPIEGIWVRDEKYVIAIVKTSVVNPQSEKYKKCDYLGINLTKENTKVGLGISFTKDIGEICVGFIKTKYDFSFKSSGFWARDAYWKLLTPTLLQYDGDYAVLSPFANQVFIRIYPPAP